MDCEYIISQKRRVVKREAGKSEKSFRFAKTHLIVKISRMDVRYCASIRSSLIIERSLIV